MKQFTVGISGINAVDNPGPGVGVARSLKDDKELNVNVVGFAYDAMEPGIYMDWLIDKVFVMPYPSGGRNAFIDRLRHVRNSYGLDFIIPNLDAELPLYTKYRTEIEDLGIRVFLPDHEQYRLRGKDRLPEVAEKINVEIPQTRVVSSAEEFGKALEQIGLPVMVKGAFYNAHQADTAQEAFRYFNKIVSEWGYPVILQKVVSGEEMNVVAVGDGDGELIGQVGIKKMWITSLGKIWTGVTVKNERMQAATENFVREYRWKGPLEMECIVDGDTVYLIEINPRFLAWSYFATAAGMNLPAQMLRRAFDLPMNRTRDYEAGKLYIRYTYEIITNMDIFQNLLTKGES